MNEQTKKEIRKEVSEIQAYCQEKLNVLYEERSEQELNNGQSAFISGASEPLEISKKLADSISRMEAKQRDIEMWRQNVENIIISGPHNGYELQAVQDKTKELKKDIKTILGEDE